MQRVTLHNFISTRNSSSQAEFVVIKKWLCAAVDSKETNLFQPESAALHTLQGQTQTTQIHGLEAKASQADGQFIKVKSQIPCLSLRGLSDTRTAKIFRAQ